MRFPRLVALVVMAAPACGGRSTVIPEVTRDAASAPCATTGTGVTALLQSAVISGVVVQGTDVLAATDLGVIRVPLKGGAATTLVAGDVSGLVVLGADAYYGDSASDSIYAVPLAGGSPMPAISQAAIMSPAATDTTTIYLSSGGALAALTPPAMTPVDIPLDGVLLVDAIAVYGGWIYVAAQELSGRRQGLIERVPLGGGPAARIVTGIGHPWSLVAGDAGLFWAQDPAVGTYGNGDVMSAHLDGTALTKLLPQVSASALALEGDTLFIASDQIARMPASGGSVTVLAGGVTQPGFLAIAGRNVLWVDRATKAFSDSTPSTIETTCW